jgi:N-acetylmuramoyl-L-alanine amidase
MQNEPNRKTTSILLILICGAFLTGWIVSLQKNKPSLGPVGIGTDVKTAPQPRISQLGKMPDWSQLEVYQSTITREKFVDDLTKYFTCSEAWKNFIEVSDTHAIIRIMVSDPTSFFRLNFATAGHEKPAPLPWRKPGEWRNEKSDKVLGGLHVAIDAGHLGGEWAQMEERWYKLGDGVAVTEGDMTLFVARLLKPALEAQGAKVTLVRNSTVPLTKDRPETLVDEVKKIDPMLLSPYQEKKAAEGLFYRTSEIRARADFVNDTIKPDIVLCLHFNAASWGDPARPTLVEENHFHILLNGAYTDDEIGLDDQRFEMIRKILQGTIHEEAALGAAMADVFSAETQLPPYPYEAGSTRARNVAGHPYLWARNLLANRLYNCPVIFFEPYVMNSLEVYERVQAGDYPGMPVVAGKPRKSIYREYADAVVDGMLEYYKKFPAK